MKTAWFFGDSFVYGWGCKDKTNDKDKIMSQIVSEHLNCKENNLAQYGYSNENILFSILTNINRIKKGDYVIIFDTHSVRSPFVREDLDFYSNWPELSYFEIPKNKSDMYYSFRGELTSKLLPYYQSMFNNLVDFLKFNEINSYYFPSNDKWWIHKKINHNSQEDGAHWSFKGHAQVAKWIIDIIEKNNII